MRELLNAPDRLARSIRDPQHIICKGFAVRTKQEIIVGRNLYVFVIIIYHWCPSTGKPRTPYSRFLKIGRSSYVV
jgi:hypothetical protein